MSFVHSYVYVARGGVPTAKPPIGIACRPPTHTAPDWCTRGLQNTAPAKPSGRALFPSAIRITAIPRPPLLPHFPVKKSKDEKNMIAGLDPECIISRTYRDESMKWTDQKGKFDRDISGAESCSLTTLCRYSLYPPRATTLSAPLAIVPDNVFKRFGHPLAC